MPKGDNAIKDAGIKIIRRAIQAPLRQIAEKCRFRISCRLKNPRSDSKTFWLRRANKEYVDMLKAGIIDPTTKVVRIALEYAAHRLPGLLITTEART
jgi:chaperonin GroEL